MAEREVPGPDQDDPFTRFQKRAPFGDHSGGLLSLWFGFRQTVGRRAYAASGFGLMLLKYVVEAAVIWNVVHVAYTPLDFLNPSLSARQQLTLGAPDWLPWAWLLWTLAFLWIAVGMSVRRAVNAGQSPWIGLLVLVPLVNLVVMLYLALVPESPAPHWRAPESEARSALNGIQSCFIGVAAGMIVFGVMLALSVYMFDSYGASIFLGTPVLMGAVSSTLFNWASPRSLGGSIFIGMFTVVLAGMALLLFALEGIICIVMAAPILIPLGGLGGAMGMAIAAATTRRAPGMFFAFAFLPVWSGVESIYTTNVERLVVSQVEIDATPEQVWNYVVAIPDLPEPEEWYFRLGIACPMKASINGHGVGATRECIFTTGTFVEPITVWDEPHRLAFDVTEQPAPMFELTPYHHVHPPHLDGTMSSKRGEFRLVALPDGRTRLEGRTWYELEMAPQMYWTLWSDLIIRRIHDRVLRHVKRLTEDEGARFLVPGSW